jgi:4-carboxymuconolactone decarboxylase
VSANGTAGPRVPRLTPDLLDEQQREVYDAIAGGPRAQGPQLFQLRDAHGALEGPFNAFLLQPRLGSALQAVGSAVRYQTALTDRAREIAILLVARHWDCEFEWYAHEAVGRHVGLTDAELKAVRDGDVELFTDDLERAVALTTHRLLAGGDLDDEAYAAAVAVLGLPTVFELTTLVGYYATLALQLRVFRVATPHS